MNRLYHTKRKQIVMPLLVAWGLSVLVFSAPISMHSAINSVSLTEQTRQVLNAEYDLPLFTRPTSINSKKINKHKPDPSASLFFTLFLPQVNYTSETVIQRFLSYTRYFLNGISNRGPPKTL